MDKETKEFTRTSEESEVDKRRFAYVMGGASTAMIVALLTFFSIGMVGAALGVGIGGFVANFEEVSYTDGNAQVYPTLGTQAACDKAPQLEASLSGTTTITGGVEFFKDLPLPSNFGTNFDFARITIIGNGTGGITAQDLDLRLTALETANLSLSGADIQEFSPSEYDNGSDAESSYVPSGTTSVTNDTTVASETPEFGITADEFVLPQGGSAAAHQVSFASLDLEEVNLFVQILNSSNATSNGPTERTVAPGSRDCDSLASASNSGAANDVDSSSGGLDLKSPS